MIKRQHKLLGLQIGGNSQWFPVPVIVDHPTHVVVVTTWGPKSAEHKVFLRTSTTEQFLWVSICSGHDVPRLHWAKQPDTAESLLAEARDEIANFGNSELIARIDRCLEGKG